MRSDIYEKISLSRIAAVNSEFGRRALGKRASIDTPYAVGLIGFFISPCGLALIYQSKSNAFAANPFHVVMFDGEWVVARAYPLECLAHFDDRPGYGLSNACLVRIDRTPLHWLEPKRNNFRDPDVVYSLAVSAGQWRLAEGDYRGRIAVEPASGISTIETSIDVYHGSCGSSLVDSDGSLVGFGARLELELGSNGFEKRKFGIGNFECIRDLFKILDIEKRYLTLSDYKSEIALLSFQEISEGADNCPLIQAFSQPHDRVRSNYYHKGNVEVRMEKENEYVAFVKTYRNDLLIDFDANTLLDHAEYLGKRHQFAMKIFIMPCQTALQNSERAKWYAVEKGRKHLDAALVSDITGASVIETRDSKSMYVIYNR